MPSRPPKPYKDPLKSNMVAHMRKYRPDSITTQLANECQSLRNLKQQIGDWHDKQLRRDNFKGNKVALGILAELRGILNDN